MILFDYPGHFVAALLLTGSAALVLLVFRSGELQKAGLRPYKRWLILLQYVCIVILLLILWNPSQAKINPTRSRDSVLAFFDTSESMSVADDGRLSRLDKAITVFQETFRPLDADGSAHRIFGFDSQTYHSGSTDFLRRWGSQTDIHTVFSALAKSEPVEKKGVAGAVIFTDGQAQDKNPLAYLPLDNKNSRVVLIGVGSKDRRPDVAIESFDAPSRMAIDTACNVKVAVTARNLKSQAVTVELLKDNYVISSMQIPPEAFRQAPRPGDDSHAAAKAATVEFTVGADTLGSHTFSVRAKTTEQELNPANNTRSTVVDVVQETAIKVLFYSQVASFDIGKIREALAGDDKIQLDFGMDAIKAPVLAEKALQTCGHVKLPADRRGFHKYDVIVLGPCDLNSLTDAQVEGLYSFVVDRGGGLILIPGKNGYGPDAWTDKKARALLPAVLDGVEPAISSNNSGKIELTLDALDGGVLGPETLKDCFDPALPYYPAVDCKPASTTLAVIKDTPAIMSHRVGRGRVCLLNISKLFLLYREDLEGGPLYEIISQLTAHCARITSREAGIELFAERDTEQASKVRFAAYVCDDSFAPVAGANVLLSVADVVLSMDEAERGYYVAEMEGVSDQAIIATAQAETSGVFLGERTIAVNLPPARGEMADVELDDDFLQALAKRFDGKYLHVDEVDENIAQTFKAQTQAAQSRRMTSIWPNWPLLLVLCVLLSVVWFLRRAVGLV